MSTKTASEPVDETAPKAAPARRVLTKQEILTRHAPKLQEVPTPEWGGEGAVVLVRGMTGRERDEWEESLMDQDSKEAQKRKKGSRITLENQRARVVAMCAVNKHGGRLFSDFDVRELGELDAAPLDRIYDVVMSLSGVSDTDLDDILGKFRAAASSDSPSS